MSSIKDFGTVPCIKLPKANQSSYTYTYSFWLNYLFEMCMRLFDWEGAEDSGIPEKEIERILLMNGSAGFAKYKRMLGVFFGVYAGEQTLYYDLYKSYTVYSPLYSDTLEIGKKVQVIENNATKTTVLQYVHNYAVLLAHLDVTFVSTLINGREKSVPIARTRKEIAAFTNYRNDLCNGRFSAIPDPSFVGIDFKAVPTDLIIPVKELMEVRENIIHDFLEGIGIKSAWNKKGNMIEGEVQANDSMLVWNLSDMRYSREKGAEKVNSLFGCNLVPKLKKEIQINLEGGLVDVDSERDVDRSTEGE